MKALILTGHEILQLGFPQGKVIGVVIRVVSENYTEEQKEYVLNFLKGILKYPERFYENKVFREVVDIMLRHDKEARKRGKRAPLIDFSYEGKPLAEACS